MSCPTSVICCKNSSTQICSCVTQAGGGAPASGPLGVGLITDNNQDQKIFFRNIFTFFIEQ